MKLSLSNLCGVFFFAATAVNVAQHFGLASVLSFISGTLFFASEIQSYIRNLPAPIRFPTKEGLARMRARLKALRERKPSPELIEALAPPQHPHCYTYKVEAIPDKPKKKGMKRVKQPTAKQVAEALQNFKPNVPISFIVADRKARRNR